MKMIKWGCNHDTPKVPKQSHRSGKAVKQLKGSHRKGGKGKGY